MMRFRLVAAIGAVWAATALVPGCSSDSNEATSDAGASDANVDSNFDPCASFSGSGTACSAVSTTTMCTIAGCAGSPCYCVQGPSGPKWTCVNGTCGAPVKPPPGTDGGNPPPTDGGNPPPHDSGGADTNPPVDSSPGIDSATDDASDGATE